jgi:hypothetical protein
LRNCELLSYSMNSLMSWDLKLRHRNHKLSPLCPNFFRTNRGHIRILISLRSTLILFSLRSPPFTAFRPVRMSHIAHISHVMSVRLPECISTAQTGRIFEKFVTCDLRKSARKPNLLKTGQGQEYRAFYMKV